MSGFGVNASTNSTRSGAFPENPCPNPVDPISNPPLGCRRPVKITSSGWYTFRHTFRAGSFVGCPRATCLVVDFEIFDHSGAPIPGGHWTIHSTADLMSMVGGNRYGWFSTEEIPDLAIDNSLRTGLCHGGDGDGDVEGNDSRKAHMHFHKNTCESGGDVDEDDGQQVGPKRAKIGLVRGHKGKTNQQHRNPRRKRLILKFQTDAVLVQFERIEVSHKIAELDPTESA